MSRKAKYPISVPNGVDINVKQNIIDVKGPKGNLNLAFNETVNVTVVNNEISVQLVDENSGMQKFQGLYHALVKNMVEGVTTGFVKSLQMIGVGYRAAVKGNTLDLQIGKSHPTVFDIPKDLEVKVVKNTLITISGADKQAVGEFAACIRRTRKPEPYQGKGIRYVDEFVRRKAGKSAAGAKK